MYQYKLFRQVMRAVLFALLLAGCGSSTVTAPSIDSTATPTQVTPTAVSPSPTLAATTIDASTLTNKVIFGYQGWFSCPGDGGGLPDSSYWTHWFDYNSAPTTASLTVDFWPDTSELTPDEQCVTDITLPDSRSLVTYSSYNTQTVLRHFQWMAEYGIDGVELQRFLWDDISPVDLQFKDQVLANVILGAEAYGRVFYIRYAAQQQSDLEVFKRDWPYLVDELKVTENPRYLHHNGLPLVGIYGLGFTFEDIEPAQAMDFIEFFQSNPVARYRATVVGGIPSYWRTLSRDSRSDPAWAEVYRSLNVINPMSAGRFTNDYEADIYLRDVIIPDLAESDRYGIDYMPLVQPGYSGANLMAHRGGSSVRNAIPRKGGKFYWRQVYNAISAGADMLYVSMFDEVDEGMAMFKLVTTGNDLPTGYFLIPLDIDGYCLPSDWYLLLGGETGKALRGEIPLSPEMPLDFPTNQTCTPASEPQVVLLRGVQGCMREQTIIANRPIQLHYGAWGSIGFDFAEASWELIDITLTIDGEEFEGEKQPLAADLVKNCGPDAENIYWMYYIADIGGLPPGIHDLKVTYQANGEIDDGTGKTYGPGIFLTDSFTLNSMDPP